LCRCLCDDEMGVAALDDMIAIAGACEMFVSLGRAQPVVVVVVADEYGN
jgi:hypothetical protein